MTVGQLIQKLSKLPSDMKVVIDNSRDYEDIDEVKGIVGGIFSNGFCGGSFEKVTSKGELKNINSVMIV